MIRARVMESPRRVGEASFARPPPLTFGNPGVSVGPEKRVRPRLQLLSAPKRSPRIAATDFFSAEVWTSTGLTTYYVLFVIELKTRRVHVAGITTKPDGAFMAQIARNLTGSGQVECTEHLGGTLKRYHRAA